MFGLQEEFSEGRMCLVGGARIQRNFRIAGDLQSARPFPVIQQRDAADLRVRVGNNRDLVQGIDLPITPAQHAFDTFPSIRSAHVVRAIERYLNWHWNSWRQGREVDAGAAPGDEPGTGAEA